MIAVTRPVSASLADCQLTHVARTPLDVGRAREQHEHYEAALRQLGAEVVRVPAADDLPDAVFVEDVAIVLEDCALVATMGSPVRRRERDAVASVLARYVETVHAHGEGRFDGGDVLRIGRTLHVGVSARTDRAGFELVRDFAVRRGFDVNPVPVRGCLHLKTAATCIGEHTVLVDPAFVPPERFAGAQVLHVHAGEVGAANALRLGESLLVIEGAPRTAEMLARAGFQPRTLDISELEKAEAGLTCMSILIDARTGDTGA